MGNNCCNCNLRECSLRECLSCAWAKEQFHKNVPIDIYDTVECCGTTISRDTVNLWYWGIFRGLFTLYVVFILLWSFFSDAVFGEFGWTWFVYITHWGLIFNSTYMISTSILHFRCYNGIKSKLDGKTSIANIDAYPTIEELGLTKHWDWVVYLLNSSLAWTIWVIILYYALLYDGGYLHPLSVHTHGICGGLVLIEWFTSTWQLSYVGAWYTFCWASLWVFVSIIFYASGAKNHDGDRYIYSVMDWSKPGTATLYAILITVAMVICHITLVWTKNQIMKWWLNSRTEQEKDKLVVEGTEADDHAANEMDPLV